MSPHPNEFCKTKRGSSTRQVGRGQLKYALYDLICCMIAAASSIGIRTGALDKYTYYMSEWTAVHDVSEVTLFNQDDGGKMFLSSSPLNYMLIFAVFIPISLGHYRHGEVQMFFIQWDRQCTTRKTTFACQVPPRLNESLGMVNHVFSDKTGTLTCNIMEFQSIDWWGQLRPGHDQIGRGRMRREGIPIPPEPKLRKGAKETNMVNFITIVCKAHGQRGRVGALVHAEHVPQPRGHARPGPRANNDFYGGPHRTRSSPVWFGKHMGMSLSTSRRAHPWPLKRQRASKRGRS